MRIRTRRTLVWRVVLTLLLLGFPTIWVLLMSIRCVEFRSQEERSRVNFGSMPGTAYLRAALGPAEEPAEAHIIMATIDRINTTIRKRDGIPQDVLVQLWDRRTGRPVYSSPALADQALSGSPAARTSQLVHGRFYYIFELDTPRWRLFWARTPYDKWWLLRTLDDELFQNMSIAFVCLLLPAWLAVSRGLLPLRRFSGAIVARGPNDMTPLTDDPKYSEMIPLKEALNGLLAKLRRKIESEQAFVANAAHELRTPLAVITAQAHVLTKVTTEQERVDAKLRLEMAIARASHLIHQLLVLARMEMERRPGPDTFDVAQAVRQGIADFVPAALTRNMEISLEAPDRLTLSLEAHPFQSILQNLLDNAIRYGRDGGRILVLLQPGNAGGITLSVADDGPGVADQDRSRIFDRFQRGASGQDGIPGTGLGLTIVRQAAARLGGVVWLTDGLGGRGCCFTVAVSRTVTCL